MAKPLSCNTHFISLQRGKEIQDPPQSRISWKHSGPVVSSTYFQVAVCCCWTFSYVGYPLCAFPVSFPSNQGEAGAGVRADWRAACGSGFRPDFPSQPIQRRLLPSPSQLPPSQPAHDNWPSSVQNGGPGQVGWLIHKLFAKVFFFQHMNWLRWI